MEVTYRLAIENDLKRQGISAIRLDTFSGNPFALRLYAKMGYEMIGHVDWRKGRFLLMEKSLKGKKEENETCGLF